MSSTGSQAKEESCPQSSPQPGRSGRSVPAPARTAGQSCLETQHTHLEHPDRGHCQPEWGLGQHGHDSKCRSTSQVPALALCLQPSPLNVIFPHCRLHFYRSSHGNIPHTLSRSLCFFPFPPLKEAVFIWLEPLSRAWMGLWTHRQLQTWLAAWLC